MERTKKNSHNKVFHTFPLSEYTKYHVNDGLSLKCFYSEPGKN